MARDCYRGRELTAGAPSGRGGRGDPHHDVGGRWGNVVWPGVDGEEWRHVELVAVTLGAQRRGAKGGEVSGGGWGCSRGPFYRVGDREVGGRGSSADGR
jgi:hypothetical protein